MQQSQALLQVQSDLIEMSKLVQVAMSCGTESLLSADVSLAENVISDDIRINAINAKVEEACLSVLSSGNLNEDEVRISVALLRMSTTLERMGDLAAHVAKQARLRFPNISVPEKLHSTFHEMGEIANSIVASTTKVIETQDLRFAADMTALDEKMDQIHRELFTIVLSPDWAEGVEAAIDVTLLSRYYERFADHGVTIARRIAFIVTGETYGVSDLTASAENA
jgi:phosphate transport system protein